MSRCVCAFNDLGSEVIVRFLDIGAIVDHHFLNFTFIMRISKHNTILLRFVKTPVPKNHVVV